MIAIALLKFYELYGHYKVPVLFQVPADSSPSLYNKNFEITSKKIPVEDITSHKHKPLMEHSFEEWPEEVRGLKLGFKFHNMYYRRSQVDYRSVIEAQGCFVDMEAPHSLWSTNIMYGDLLVALKEFKLLHGHLNVPEDYIIPMDGKNDDIADDNCDIDNDYYDCRNNKMSYNDLSNHSYDNNDSDNNDNNSNNDYDDNDNDNNDVTGSEKDNENKNGKNTGNKMMEIKHVRRKYSEKINEISGTKNLDSNSNNILKWSKKSQGIKLGQKVRLLRFRAKFLAKNREELTAIGFDWRCSENNE